MTSSAVAEVSANRGSAIQYNDWYQQRSPTLSLFGREVIKAVCANAPRYAANDHEIWHAFWQMVIFYNVVFGAVGFVLSSLELASLLVTKLAVTGMGCESSHLLLYLAAANCVINLLIIAFGEVVTRTEARQVTCQIVTLFITSCLYSGCAGATIFVATKALVGGDLSECWPAILSLCFGSINFLNGIVSVVVYIAKGYVRAYQDEMPLPNFFYPEFVGIPSSASHALCYLPLH